METTLIPQRTEAWKAQRIGKFTSSEIHKLMGTAKRLMTEGELVEYKKANPKSTAKQIEDDKTLCEAAETYVLQKIAETLTGECQEISTMATDHGNQYEGLAREMFEASQNLKVDECGFIPCEAFKNMAGGSPDGLIGKDAILEIKCPFASVNHLQHRLIDSDEYFKKYFKEYYYQCQANMHFSNRTKCYFASFDPRMFGTEGLFVYELLYDKGVGELIEKKIRQAIAYRNEILTKINHDLKKVA